MPKTTNSDGVEPLSKETSETLAQLAQKVEEIKARVDNQQPTPDSSGTTRLNSNNRTPQTGSMRTPETNFKATRRYSAPEKTSQNPARKLYLTKEATDKILIGLNTAITTYDLANFKLLMDDLKKTDPEAINKKLKLDDKSPRTLAQIIEERKLGATSSEQKQLEFMSNIIKEKFQEPKETFRKALKDQRESPTIGSHRQ